jgi:hypothetical protein
VENWRLKIKEITVGEEEKEDLEADNNILREGREEGELEADNLGNNCGRQGQ